MQDDGRVLNTSLDAAMDAAAGPKTTVQASRRGHSGLAIASLVLGIVSVLGGYFIVPPILAIVFGNHAIKDCDRYPDLEGRGMAVAGRVLGWVALAAWILLGMIFFLGGLALIGAILSTR